ncbi:MAG: hypothetical protein AAF989_06430, partial [Planctomycetota bacterium]
MAVFPAVARSQEKPVPRQPSFVMTNEIKDQGGQTQDQHVVVFHEGRIYDFSKTQPRFVTVYDLSGDRVVLLDRNTQGKAEIGTEALLQRTTQAQVAATARPNAEELGFHVQVATSEDYSRFATRYGRIQYEVMAEPCDDPLVAIAYSQFVDWASRLGVARSMGPPPFARMSVNAEIVKQSRIPVLTRMTIEHNNDQQQTLAATHRKSALTEDLLAKVNEARG